MSPTNRDLPNNSHNLAHPLEPDDLRRIRTKELRLLFWDTEACMEEGTLGDNTELEMLRSVQEIEFELLRRCRCRGDEPTPNTDLTELSPGNDAYILNHPLDLPELHSLLDQMSSREMEQLFWDTEECRERHIFGRDNKETDLFRTSGELEYRLIQRGVRIRMPDGWFGQAGERRNDLHHTYQQYGLLTIYHPAGIRIWGSIASTWDRAVLGSNGIMRGRWRNHAIDLASMGLKTPSLDPEGNEWLHQLESEDEDFAGETKSNRGRVDGRQIRSRKQRERAAGFL